MRSRVQQWFTRLNRPSTRQTIGIMVLFLIGIALIASAVIFNPVVQMAALKQPVDYARFRAFFPG